MNTRSDHLEKPMTFDGVTLTPQEEVVRAFYKDMWDHADVTLIPQIFHEDFTFRGSLGPVLVGHAQFADYVRWVTGVLQNYTTDILLMIEEGNRVSGKVYSMAFNAKRCSAIRRQESSLAGLERLSFRSTGRRCATSGCSVTSTACSGRSGQMACRKRIFHVSVRTGRSALNPSD